MLSDLEKLRVYYYGLCLNRFTHEQVIAFVNRIIEIRESPHYAYTEIALSSSLSRNGLQEKMDEIHWPTGPDLAAQTLLGIYALDVESGKLSAECLSHEIDFLCERIDTFSIAEEKSVSRLIERASNADDEDARMYCNEYVQEIRAEVITFLNKYKPLAKDFVID